MRTVTLYEYRVWVIRTPRHRYSIEVEVEAVDKDTAKDLVLWAYPKGQVIDIECMDGDH